MQASTDVLALDGGAGRRHPTLLARLLTRARPRLQERGLKQSPFERPGLAYLLLAPQLTILLFFFFIPAFRALIQAFQLSDPFGGSVQWVRSEEHTSELQSRQYLVCRLLLEKKKK